MRRYAGRRIVSLGSVVAAVGLGTVVVLSSVAAAATCTDPGSGPALTLNYFGYFSGYCNGHAWAGDGTCASAPTPATPVVVDAGADGTGVLAGTTYEFELIYSAAASGGFVFSDPSSVVSFDCDEDTSCGSGDALDVSWTYDASVPVPANDGGYDIDVIASADGGSTWDFVSDVYSTGCASTCDAGTVDPTAAGYQGGAFDGSAAGLAGLYQANYAMEYAGGVTAGATYGVEAAYVANDVAFDTAVSGLGAESTYDCTGGCETGDLLTVAWDSSAYATDYPDDGSCNVAQFVTADGGASWWANNTYDCSASMERFDPGSSTTYGTQVTPFTQAGVVSYETADNGSPSSSAGFCSTDVWGSGGGGGGGSDFVGAGFSAVESTLTGYLGDAVALVLAIGLLAIGIVMIRKWAKRAGST